MVRHVRELFFMQTLVTAFVYSQRFPSARQVDDFKPLPYDPISYRLPRNVNPPSYELHISTNVHRHEREFTGTVIINLDVVQVTSSITLHQRQLTILNQTLVNTENTTLSYLLGTPIYNETTEFFTLPIQSETISVGTKLTLTINYSGQLSTTLHGFYLSKYYFEDKEMYK